LRPLTDSSKEAPKLSFPEDNKEDNKDDSKEKKKDSPTKTCKI
jgi:hypothetical protein